MAWWCWRMRGITCIIYTLCILVCIYCYMYHLLRIYAQHLHCITLSYTPVYLPMYLPICIHLPIPLYPSTNLSIECIFYLSALYNLTIFTYTSLPPQPYTHIYLHTYTDTPSRTSGPSSLPGSPSS